MTMELGELRGGSGADVDEGAGRMTVAVVRTMARDGVRVVTAAGTAHFARCVDDRWRLSWLWERVVSEEQAREGVLLAAMVSAPPPASTPLWGTVEALLEALEVSPFGGWSRVLAAPVRPAVAGEVCECGAAAEQVLLTPWVDVPWCGSGDERDARRADAEGAAVHREAVFEGAARAAYGRLQEAAHAVAAWDGTGGRCGAVVSTVLGAIGDAKRALAEGRVAR
jgi:hypothetical protein